MAVCVCVYVNVCRLARFGLWLGKMFYGIFTSALAVHKKKGKTTQVPIRSAHSDFYALFFFIHRVSPFEKQTIIPGRWWEGIEAVYTRKDCHAIYFSMQRRKSFFSFPVLSQQSMLL
jgi:hypothetical protein